MDLTELGKNALEAQRAREASRAAELAERHKLNDATTLRSLFQNILGLDVADSDLIWDGDHTPGCHGVVVDGASLALVVVKDGLGVRALIDGRFVGVDVSLTTQQPIRSAAQLGRVLDPRRRHSVYSNDGHGRYVPGTGFVPK